MMHYDLIIRQAKVIDGSGRPGFEADVAIKNGRIARVGPLDRATADRERHAAGCVVAPGFIDTHSHADLALVAGSDELEKLRMGVSTEVIGQCGFSAHPLSNQYLEFRRAGMSGFLPGKGLDWDWSNLTQYQTRIEKTGLFNNVVPLVGHGSVRIAVLGGRDSAPSASELDRMQSLVGEAMTMGAFGLSSGLIYPPASYAETGELQALCQIVADYGGLYVTHVRGETAPLLDAAIDEAVTISKASGLPLLISHLKVIGLDSASRGKIKDVLAMIEAARHEGLDIHFDCYPYTEGSTLLSTLIPGWAHTEGLEGLLNNLRRPERRAKIRHAIETDTTHWENWIRACGWEAIKIGSLDAGRPSSMLGRNLAELAADQRVSPYDLLFDLLVQEKGNVVMVFAMMTERDMTTALLHPLGMIGTDAIPCPPGQGHPHPRGYGTFPRILGRYVREQQLLSLEEAVRKMTSLPAQTLGLHDRGLIGEGRAADLVIFDPETIIDRADYREPRRRPEGIIDVIINGRLALSDGRPTGITAGRCLKPDKAHVC